MNNLALSDEILLKIEKPVRYIGNEVNMVRKDPEGKIRFAMCFPDVYEIGMSHLGMKIIYDQMNRRDDIYCERVFSPWVDLDKVMREENIPLPSMCQPPLSLLNTGALDALLPLCAQEGIGVIPYQVLQGGILTGKYHAGQQLPAGSRAAEKPDWMKPMTDEVYATLARVEAEAKAAGQSMTQYALAWALRQPAVRCVLLGVKRRAQLEEAAAIF